MEDLAKITDEQIVSRFNATEDPAVFAEIYRRYHAQLYSAAYKRCSSTDATEEIVQDLFIKLWKNRSNIKITSSLSGYLFTTIRNMVLNHIQKEAVRKKIQWLSGFEKADYDNSTEESVLVKDLNHHIDSKLSTLPDKCRSVFELSRKHHKSNKQIASELGISEKTVENHITRAIRFLRVSLQFLLIPLLYIFFHKLR